MQLQFWPRSASILTLDVLPICRILAPVLVPILVYVFAYFFAAPSPPLSSPLPHPPFRFFASLVATFALFTAMQQTILLRVNNCNNLGLIDARCNAQVSPQAAVRAEAFVQLLTTFRSSGVWREGGRGGTFLFVAGRFRLTSC